MHTHFLFGTTAFIKYKFLRKLGTKLLIHIHVIYPYLL